MRPVRRILSLGAGVQSSALALMAEKGEIEPVDCAIFPDTGAEPKGVYEYLDYLEGLLSYPVYRVMEGEGLTRHMERASRGGFGGGAKEDLPKRFAGIPFYTRLFSEIGEVHGVPVYNTQKGMLKRQCTSEFKIRPIHRKVRELVGLKKGERAPKGLKVTQVIGISYDERQRCNDSGISWVDLEYPLVDRRLTRQWCLDWCREQGMREPAKSACVYCPYTDNARWRDMKANDPESFAEACRIDEGARVGVRGTHARLYIHRSCEPLRDAVLDDEDNQLTFLDECEGMCGL